MTGQRFTCNAHDHIKNAHAPIGVHRVLCRSFDQGSVGAYVDLAQHCIRKRVCNREISSLLAIIII